MFCYSKDLFLIIEVADIRFMALLNYLKTVEKVEQKIAYHKDKLKLHFEKWDPIRHIF